MGAPRQAMSAAPFPAAVVAEAGAAALALMRRDAGEEPAVVTRLAATALGIAEAFCGTALIARAQEDMLPVAAGWQQLAAMPVTQIAGLVTLPMVGAPGVLPAEAYAVDIDAEGVGWVWVNDAGGAARVAVSYTAGLAVDWAAMPVPIAQGVAVLIAHLFEARGEAVAPPAAVAALWRPFRQLRLAAAVRR